MQHHALVAIVTFCALVLYLMMGLRVGAARTQFGVAAPATSGNADFERVFRVQQNTLEWLPLFLVSLWLFAIFWDTGNGRMSDRVAAVIGVIWIVGRILYMTSYSKDAATRGAGFGIQALATGILLFGGFGKAIVFAIQNGV
jgi:glutathione S-transferase